MALKGQIYRTDLTSDLTEDLNLQNLIGQDRACNILQTVIDEHHWNQAFIRPILLYGGISKSIIARAFSNTIGNIYFDEVVGSQIDCGVGLHDLVNRLDGFTTYLITGIDKIGQFYQRQLFQFVKDQVIEMPEIIGVSKSHKKYFCGQLVLSAEKPSRFTAEIEKHCEATIFLNDCFSNEDVCNILYQRIDFYGVQIENRGKVVNAIVQAVNGDVRLTVKLLRWAFKCSRAEGADTVKIKHLNTALRLLG